MPRGNSSLTKLTNQRVTRAMIQELKNLANEVVLRHHHHHHLLPLNPRHLYLTIATMDLDSNHHWSFHQDRHHCHSHPSSILHTISSIDAHNSNTYSFHGPHQKTLHPQAFIAPPWNHHLHRAPDRSKSGTASVTLICMNQASSLTHLQWHNHHQPWMRNLHLKPARAAAATRKNHYSVTEKWDHIAGDEEEQRPVPIIDLAINRATNATAFPPSHQRASTVPAPATHNSNNDEQHHHRTASIDTQVTTNIEASAAQPREGETWRQKP